MSFRSRLKAYISYQNLKISDLSEEVEVTANTLYRYLNGKTDIGSDKLIKLLNSLGIEISNLVKIRDPDKQNLSIEKKILTRHLLSTIDNLDESEKRTFYKSLIRLAEARDRKLNSPALKESIIFFRSKLQ